MGMCITSLICNRFFSGKRQVSSLMVSESDFSSEEETLFINTKKMNGHSNKNGLVKQKSRIKT